MGTLNPYYYAYNPELLAFENAWVQFLKKGPEKEAFIQSVVKPEVYQSWLRCKALGLDPLSKEKIPLLSPSEIHFRLQKNKALLDIVIPFMDNLYDMIKNSGFRVDFVDADGYILRSLGDDDILEMCEKTNSFAGAKRTEDVAGTNSIALSLITGKPIQVSGAEHFCQIYHRWACSSAPIKDPDGQILGVLSASGMYELIHIHTLGMISSTAKAIGDELHIQKINKQMEKNNSQLRATLETVTDGVIYIEQNIIMQVNKEMCFLLGKDEDDIAGKNVNEVIFTTPELHELELSNPYGVQYRESEIILKGEKRNFKCLFAFRGVYEQNNNEVGTVLIFTRVDEIENLASKIKYSPRFFFKDIVGESEPTKQTIELAMKASEFDSRVIIEGESGTGKEVFAQAIHNNSARRYGPFVAIDCGTIPKDLLESELFGYVGGAFTGAKKEGKIGLFEIANKGTIFLDEVGNMPMDMQVKLLRVLQEGVFTRVGGTTPIASDVRIIAATNADLKQAIDDGTFREDLFYRLNVFNIKLPPLRNRVDDIPLLVEHYLNGRSRSKGKIDIEKKAINALQKYTWPGNIRQLENVIERALIMSNFKMIRPSDLPVEITGATERETPDEDVTLEQKTKEYILHVLKKHSNNVSKAARILNVSRSTIYKALEDTEKGEK